MSGSKTPLSPQKATKRTLLWMNLSNEPFVVLYALIPFILRKDLAATLWQISILTALRPVLPLFSLYWSMHLPRKRHLLRSNLMGAWFLGRAPFLLIPWIPTAWYLIFCVTCYELFHKSGIPALVELLKINIPDKTREKIFTLYFVLSFVESILLGLFLGHLLDFHPRAWQILGCMTALISLSSLVLQRKIPIPE
ncbi:MAG: hypothetical protein FJZ58_04145, partial [Chlamydiae bacterium]|nr:hypothetical protein [Chlamydiota bacterium]